VAKLKPPHGLVYAILIIVAILAVTLFAKHQSSSIVASTALKVQPQEPVADDAPTNAKNDTGSSAESAKSTEDAPK
jgi:hypothetical protein